MGTKLTRHEIIADFTAIAAPIMASARMSKLSVYTQHGDTDCLTHSLAVAYFCYVIARRLKLKCDCDSLVRGALLHDYFLYDWHEPGHGWHGFTHPATALRNACADFDLNPLERDIIISHMFPLTLKPPYHIESMLVCLVDKACSLYEVFAVRPYPKISGFVV